MKTKKNKITGQKLNKKTRVLRINVNKIHEQVTRSYITL